MRDIEKALKDVKSTLMRMVLFNSFLASLSIFLLFMLALTFFKVAWYFAAIPTIVYLVFKIAKETKKSGYREVEEKVPELRWQLRTAADNLNRNDEVIEGLNKRVLNKIEQVKTSYFVDGKTIFNYISRAVVLSLLILFITTVDLDFDDVVHGIKGSPIINGLLSGDFEKIKAAAFPAEEGDEDIYGDRTGNLIYGDEEEIELNTIGGLVDPTKYDKDGKGKEFYKDSNLPGDYAAQSDSSSDERINDEDKDIVRNYFDQITQQGQG